MKYVLRLIIYLAVFAFSFSVFSVLLLDIVPVNVTPLKVVRLLQNDSFSVSSQWKPLDDISPLMMRAVIATEDGNFLKHRGFDFDAIKDAIEENKRGRRVRGASTISQQTAKNVFCLPSRTWVRKGIETYYTVLIETFWSKRRIMEVYLNIIETHAGVYGAEATAQKFYKKPASALNMHEASMIATVLPSPLRMNIGKPSTYMTRRAAQVRSMMNKLGTINIDDPRGKKGKS